MKEKEIELLKRAKQGDTEAIDELLVVNKHLVVAIARKYYLLGGDKEDLIQEGMIGLFKAISSFDLCSNPCISNGSLPLQETFTTSPS